MGAILTILCKWYIRKWYIALPLTGISVLLLLIFSWWGKTPTHTTTTTGGIEVTYYPSPFSSPTNPKMGEIVAIDKNQIQLTMHAPGIYYSDSLKTNAVIDSAYKLLFTDYSDSLNLFLPKPYKVKVLQAPSEYWTRAR